jgi:acyl carrier protein
LNRIATHEIVLDSVRGGRAITMKAMNREQVYAELTPIFRGLFEDPTLVLTDTMTAEDVPLWDSLTHITLIISVEQKFGIKFLTGEIAGLSNVGQFVNVILKKLAS